MDHHLRLAAPIKTNLALGSEMLNIENNGSKTLSKEEWLAVKFLEKVDVFLSEWKDSNN